MGRERRGEKRRCGWREGRNEGGRKVQKVKEGRREKEGGRRMEKEKEEANEEGGAITYI